MATFRSFAVLAGFLILGLIAAGCGQKEFDATELVDDLNAAGAGLMLGETLPATDEDVSVQTVSFEEPADAADEHLHSSGAITMLPDSNAALTEFERCESAVDFTCFRVANAVLRFTGITPEEQERLTQAMRSLES